LEEKQIVVEDVKEVLKWGCAKVKENEDSEERMDEIHLESCNQVKVWWDCWEKD